MALLSKLARRGPADLILGSEAFFFLAIFRLCLAVVPVRRILRVVARGHASEDAIEQITRSDLSRALRVRWAVEAATRNSAAKFVCFPQTLAGYTMLRLRRIPGTMVYGVARSAEGELIAHTWLVLGDRVVLGGEGSDAFQAIERWK